MRRVAAGLVVLLALWPTSVGAAPPGGVPDLVVDDVQTGWRTPTYVTDFAGQDCMVAEGLVPDTGIHRIMRFDTGIANIGTAPLDLGPPADNPLFRLDPCHGHYHLDGLADYRLFTLDGVEVGMGHKLGFCLLDKVIYDPAIARRNPFYNDCVRKQGISIGWSDVYHTSTVGQWIVIDGVPPGVYTLQVTVNPDGRIPDADLTNNTFRREVIVE